MKSPARNKPCPCGSSIKYKLCCGLTNPGEMPKRKSLKEIRDVRGGILGLPGQVYYLRLTEDHTAEGISDNPSGSPGKYEGFYILSKPGERPAPEGELVMNIDGDSHLTINNPIIFRSEIRESLGEGRSAEKATMTIEAIPNRKGRLAKFRIQPFEASDFADAQRQGYRMIAPLLSRLSVITVIPLHIYQIEMREVSTNSWSTSFETPPLSVTRNPGLNSPDCLSFEFLACAGLYREALSSNSQNYAFLCYYRILEWFEERQARQAMKAREQGEAVVGMPNWQIPANVQEMEQWLEELFPGGIPWDTIALEAMFPPESRGARIVSVINELTPIRDRIAHLIMDSPATEFSPFEDYVNIELIQKWLPLAHCLVRRRIKDVFPDAFKYR